MKASNQLCLKLINAEDYCQSCHNFQLKVFTDILNDFSFNKHNLLTRATSSNLITFTYMRSN